MDPGLGLEAARLAGQADLADMVRLAEEAETGLIPFRGGALLRVLESRGRGTDDDLAAALADPGRVAVAGTIGDQVVGYGLGRRERLPDGTSHGRIDALFVEPAARAVGVGEAMMELLLDWFQRQGCAGVDALALPGDRTTKNFWEGTGFKARLLVMYRPLSDRP